MDHAIINAASSLFVFLMAVSGRAHGAASKDEHNNPTGWSKWMRLASAILFGLAFAVVDFVLFGIGSLALFAGALTFYGLSTGHGRFFAMKGANLADPNPEWIERNIAPWVYHGDITKPAYSWVCMGIKGLMIGLAVPPAGLLLAILWPALYALSFRLKNDSAPAEWLTGAAAGLVLIVTLWT